jgi:phosphate transport system substrate-binding protein
VQNRNGEFVAASLESIAAAVNHSPHWSADGRNSLVNAPGEGSYPIASFTWLVTPLHFSDERKCEAMVAFLQWILGPGQAQAAAVGYLALPKEVVTRELTQIPRLH